MLLVLQLEIFRKVTKAFLWSDSIVFDSIRKNSFILVLYVCSLTKKERRMFIYLIHRHTKVYMNNERNS